MSRETGNGQVMPGDAGPQVPWWGRLLRCIIYTTFLLVSRAMFRVRFRLIGGPGGLSGTIFLGHHKSDFDGLIGLPVAYWANRNSDSLSRAEALRARARTVVVSGEHVFQPGFLAGYLVRRPRWLSFLLYHVRVDGILKAMGWHPMPQGRRRYLVSHLIDILESHGNPPLSEVFVDSPEDRVAGARPGARIRDVLKWKYRDDLFRLCEFSIFEPRIAESLLQRHKDRIAASLSLFTETLNNGGTLFLAPNGGLSSDGRMGPFKSGLSQIVEGATRKVVLVPGNITYDLMSTGRMAAFVTRGAHLRGVEAWPRERLEEEVRRAILAATTVTLGHLASRALRERALLGDQEAEEKVLKAEVRDQAHKMAREGFIVDDRLLKPRSFDQRWRRFLACGKRKGLFLGINGVLHFDPECVLSESVSKKGRVKPWVFCANELEALVEAHGSNGPIRVAGGCAASRPLRQ